MKKDVFHYIGTATIADCIVGCGKLNFLHIILTAATVMLFDYIVEKLKEKD